MSERRSIHETIKVIAQAKRERDHTLILVALDDNGLYIPQAH